MLNLKVLNEGLAQFEALLVIPIYYVVSTLLTMLAGELLYRTYLDFTRAGAASFASGVSLSLYGVYLLAHHDPDDEALKLEDGEGEGDDDEGEGATPPLSGQQRIRTVPPQVLYG